MLVATGASGDPVIAQSGESTGLSEFLYVRHTMTARCQYAETEESADAGAGVVTCLTHLAALLRWS